MIDNVVAPSDTQRDGAHVVDFEIQKLLSLGWQKYVAVVRDMAGDTNHAVVRHIATSFEGECFGGDQLVRQVRALNRTRRSYVLEEVLLHQTTERTSRLVQGRGSKCQPGHGQGCTHLR